MTLFTLHIIGWKCRDSSSLCQQPVERRDDDRRRQGVGDVDRLVDVDVVVRLHHEVQGSAGQSAEQAEEVLHQPGQVGHVAGRLKDQEQIGQRPQRCRSSPVSFFSRPGLSQSF